MTNPTPELIRLALSHIPANLPRDEWARVAMAVKSEFPDETGFDLFDAWSQSAADGYDAKDVRSTWRSIKAGGGVTIATLLHLAKQHGFELPKPDQPPAAPSAAELARRNAERQRAEKVESDRQQAAHAVAAGAARSLWEGASASGGSAYLQRKGVQAHGLRFVPDGSVLVPLRDADGVLWNVQRIAPERPANGTDKLFQKGGRKSGLWHMLGDPKGAAALLVAEGYATAASVHEAGGWPVAVAFDAGNLARVARELRRLYPAALLVLCGDDDGETEARTGTNPGRVKAEAAARAVQGRAVFPAPMPEGAPCNFDFNDLHQARGLDAVRAAVQSAIDAAATPAPATTPKQRQRPARGAAGAGGGGGGKEGPDHDPFIVNDEGVYFLGGNDKNGHPARPLWLCSRLDVAASTRDQQGHSWGYLLQFADLLGHPKQWAMPARMLAGDGGEYRAALLNMGLRIATSPTARNRLTEYIQTRQPSEFAICTDRIGWHQTESGAAYVLTHQTVGAGDELIVFQSDNVMENTFRVRKDARAWRERIGALCAGNSRLVFAVACAFAGPLLRPYGMESGGFHLRGGSSGGKTTALRLAASVNGGPSYMQRWRTTDNALEATAAQHCDALLILDELSQVDGKVAGECAYMLANEQSKGRSGRASVLRARLSWRLLFLSSGELSLADHMAEGMKRVRTGQEVRMADIPADAGAGMEMFENIHGHDSPSAFASHLTRQVQAVYGAPGLAFIEWACARWGELPRRLRDGVQALAGQWVPAGASGQVERVAARFALVGVAGELATEAGLTSWERGESERAARKCFEAWLAARGGTGNGEVTAMLRQVRRFLEAHGEGRFTWWHRGADDHNAKTLQRAGYRRMVDEHGESIKTNSDHLVKYGDEMRPADGERVCVDYFILPEVFRSEVAQGFDAQSVARVLLDRECLQADDGRLVTRKRLPGMGLSWCYHITPKLFELAL